MSNFGGWGTPGGGFNWNMLANVGAGMLANSQYSPGQAFGKGYEQASANSLEQAKTGLLFQDAEQKRQQYKIHQEAMKALMENPLMNGQGAGPQQAPTAGANLGMPAQQAPMQDPGANYVGGQSPPAPPPQQMAQAAQPQQGGAPQTGGFDTDTFNKLVTLSAKLKSLGEDDGAQAVMSKATAMKTLYDVENNRGQLEVSRGNLAETHNQNQFNQTDANRKYEDAHRETMWKTGGDDAEKRYRTIVNGELSAQTKNGTLDLMDKMVRTPGFYSGMGGEAVLQYKRALRGLGIKGSEGVSSMEGLFALNKQSVLDNTGGSLGNQISNGDRVFIEGTKAGLHNTPEGNLMLNSIQRKLNDREQEVGKMARAYYKSHGKTLDSGWDDQLAEFREAHPLFTEEAAAMDKMNVPQQGVQGGGSTAPPASAAPLHFDRATGKISRVTPTQQAPQAPPPPANTGWTQSFPTLNFGGQ